MRINWIILNLYYTVYRIIKDVIDVAKVDFEELHQELDALLKDHEVDFDDSNLPLDTIYSLHVKTDELIRAHNLKFNGSSSNSIEALNAKLNILVQEGHNTDIDQSLDEESIDLTNALLEKLIEEHGVNQ